MIIKVNPAKDKKIAKKVNEISSNDSVSTLSDASVPSIRMKVTDVIFGSKSIFRLGLRLGFVLMSS
jgi:hypothetical protein